MAGSAQTRSGQPSAKCRFTTTHWSVVLAAGHDSSPAAQDALESLCRTYWHPIYSYLRCRGYKPEDAQDLTQGFFASLLERQSIRDLRRDRGKFRSFLLAAVSHFSCNQADRARAAKRGGGHPVFSLDQAAAEAHYAFEPSTELSPEKIYERRWAMTVLETALARVEAEADASGKSAQFACLKGYIAHETPAGEYVRLGAQLGMSAHAVAEAVHRLRQRYRKLVRAEIARTVADPAEIDDEVRHLFRVLSG